MPFHAEGGTVFVAQRVSEPGQTNSGRDALLPGMGHQLHASQDATGWAQSLLGTALLASWVWVAPGPTEAGFTSHLYPFLCLSCNLVCGTIQASLVRGSLLMCLFLVCDIVLCYRGGFISDWTDFRHLGDFWVCDVQGARLQADMILFPLCESL